MFFFKFLPGSFRPLQNICVVSVSKITIARLIIVVLKTSSPCRRTFILGKSVDPDKMYLSYIILLYDHILYD